MSFFQGQQSHRLEKLELRHCNEVTGASLGLFRNLKSVTLGYCDGFSPAGLVAVCGLPLLERLELEWIQCIPFKGFVKQLRRTTHLQHLSLLGCQVRFHSTAFLL